MSENTRANPNALSRAAAHRLMLKKQKRVLAAIRRYGKVTAAARLAGVSVSAICRWKRDYPDFRDKYEEAEEEFGERLHDVVVDAAINGYKKPIASGGRIVGEEIVYDNKLLWEVARKKVKRFKEDVQQTELTILTGASATLAAKLDQIIRRRSTEDDKGKPE